MLMRSFAGATAPAGVTLAHSLRASATVTSSMIAALPASARRDADARASASVMVFLVFLVWVALIVYACAPAYVFTGARCVFWLCLTRVSVGSEMFCVPHRRAHMMCAHTGT